MLGLGVDVPTTDPWYGLYSFGWTLEGPIAFVCAFLVLRGLWRVLPLSVNRAFLRDNPGVGLARVSLLFAGVWFWFVLQTGAASDIIGFYTIMYTLLAFSALLYAGFRFPVIGLYYLGDVVERGNLAAGIALAGFAMGTAFAFGGALTGEGPGWWVVVVFFFLAYWELRGNMSLVGRLGSLKDEVRLERDISAGVLLGSVAMASGLVAGRAAAGDFHGWARDIPDYLARLWPLIPIALIGAFAGAYSQFHKREAQIRIAAAVVLVLLGLLYYFLYYVPAARGHLYF